MSEAAALATIAKALGADQLAQQQRTIVRRYRAALSRRDIALPFFIVNEL